MAFNAHLSAEAQPTSSATAPFDVVRLNYGNAYDDTTYEFTAPVTGVYQFTVSLLVKSGKHGLMYLKVNGATEMSVHERPSCATCSTGSANTATMQLTQGDKVSVEMYGGPNYPYHYMDSTSFNGALLFETCQ